MKTKLKWKTIKNENPRKVKKLIETVVCKYRNLEFKRFKNWLLILVKTSSRSWQFPTAL